jgi:hypothetical protein
LMLKALRPKGFCEIPETIAEHLKKRRWELVIQEMSQRERFVAAARSVGAAESATAFDEAFAKVVRPPTKPQRSR